MKNKMRKVCLRAALLGSGLSLTLPATAFGQSTVYVDADNGDDSSGDGSEVTPWRRINRAVAAAEEPLSIIDRIVIKAGIYDQAVETVAGAGGFPIELTLPLEFEAYDDEDLPVIGGGVEDTTVRALFEVVTETAEQDLQGVVFRNLVFSGEDSSGVNAPGALYIESSNGRKAQVVVDNCVIRRSEMNDSGGGGHPSIHAIGGYKPAGNNPEAPLSLEVIACRVEANASGGVVVDLGKDCSDTNAQRGLIDLTVHTVTVVQDNQIRGCGLRALSFECMTDGVSGSGLNIQSWKVDRNIITDNLGYGLVVDGGSNLSNSYLRIYARGNVMANNGKSGVYVSVENYGTGYGSGEVGLLWCTMTGNAEYGIEVPSGSAPEYLGYLQNCIVWGNTLGSAVGWYPCLNAASGGFHHNVWECFGPDCLDAEDYPCVASGCNPASSTGYNMDVDPDMVDPGSGDVHLAQGSCCIDRGTNSPTTVAKTGYTTDIDGESRLWDGDGNGSRVADIGADEYHP